MINVFRSIHHISASTLDDLEKEVLRMNLLTQRSVEVFQVTKVGKEWIAYFNIDSIAFANYKKATLKKRVANGSE